MFDNQNGGEIVARDKSTGLFKPGHSKAGGKQKGWKSAKTILRELLQKLSIEKNGKKITALQAILSKQIDIAIKEGKLDHVRFILEQAGDLINGGVVEPNNSFSFEKFEQIINSDGFLEIEEEDRILIKESKVENIIN